jgi:dUTP pyrophosphatase
MNDQTQDKPRRRSTDLFNSQLVEPTMRVKRLHPDAKLPTRGSQFASGLDLYAVADHAARTEYVIYPHDCVPIPTGIAVEVQPGYEAQVRPRSGLARKHWLTVLNTPGTVDADYRGEIIVLLYNAGSGQRQYVKPGERIAQLVIAPVILVVPAWSDELTDTARAAGGFGSTGRE